MEHSSVLNGKRRRDSSRRVDTVEKGLVPKTGAVTSQKELVRERAKESMTALNKERKQLREKNVGVQAKFTADFN